MKLTCPFMYNGRQVPKSGCIGKCSNVLPVPRDTTWIEQIYTNICVKRQIHASNSLGNDDTSCLKLKWWLVLGGGSYDGDGREEKENEIGTFQHPFLCRSLSLSLSLSFSFSIVHSYGTPIEENKAIYSCLQSIFKHCIHSNERSVLVLFYTCGHCKVKWPLVPPSMTWHVDSVIFLFIVDRVLLKDTVCVNDNQFPRIVMITRLQSKIWVVKSLQE